MMTEKLSIMNSQLKTNRRIVVMENGLISTYTMRNELMLTLLNQNFEVHVLTHTNQFKKEVEDSGLKVYHVGSGNTNPLKILMYVCKVFYFMRRVQPDVCLTFSVRPAIWGNIVARILGIPVIANISGIGPLFSSKNMAYRFIRFIYPFALSKTEKIFFQNEEDRETFISHRFIVRQKTDRIPGSGVDYLKFAPVPCTNKITKNFSFLFIGRLVKDKGILEFIEAAKIMKAQNPAINFKVIGPLLQQNLRSNTLTKKVVYQWVSEGIIEYEGEKKDVRKDIAAADCIVLPSYREGISNVLLEAASMEKACIATNVTGCKEIIEDGKTGLLCRVRDASDLAAKMKQMIALPESALMEMGKQARQKMIREFDKRIVLNCYLKEIKNISSKSEVNPVNLSRMIHFSSMPSLAKSNAV
jgi:glycosyltransferase involved in cell wall biosynthesis